jgi:hypothetical protein
VEKEKISSLDRLSKMLGKPARHEWLNIGGQLVPKPAINGLVRDIHHGKVKSWDEVHAFYKESSEQYLQQKAQHAFASMLEILQLTPASFNQNIFLQLVQQAVATREWMVKNIYESRAKDYTNPFRKMVYESQKEMEKIIGSLKDNAFIRQQQEELAQFKKLAVATMKNFKS